MSMQMCTEGFNCKRKICFFAHDEQQLRHPDYSYGYKNVTEAVSSLRCLKPGAIMCFITFAYFMRCSRKGQLHLCP